MIHSFPRHILILPLLFPTNQPRRVPHCRGPRRHINHHQTPRPNLRPFPDLHIPQNRRTRPDQHPIPNLRMPISPHLPGPTQRHMMQNRHIIPDNRGLPDHHTRRMIQQYPFTNPSRGMDIHGENIRYPRVQRKCYGLPV
ncbi:hypothetical protein Hanom_Chr09g00868861 [Helianthus anomalus]